MSLILAVGAQNLYVLRQGLLRKHVFAICLFATISDALLIWTGVLSFELINSFAIGFAQVMTLAGSLFLAAYGCMRIWSAYRGVYDLELDSDGQTLHKAILTIAAFTFFNPHVYLDTLGLIGAVSAQYPTIAQKYSFATGASFGSLIFFFSLGYGARVLAPIMASATAWRVLDVGVGITMWFIAGILITT